MATKVYKPIEKFRPIFAGGTLTPPKFMPTYYEWLSLIGQQVLMCETYLVGAVITYTVPEGFNLFVTSASVAVADTDKAELQLRDPAGNFISNIIAVGYASAASSGGSSVSISPKIPIRVESQESLSYNGAKGNISFSGFLVKKSDILGLI